MLRNNQTNSNIRDLHHSTKRFCFLIENINDFNRQQWLSEISLILPRIHAVIGILDDHRTAECLYALTDVDERFELFCTLKQTLGEKDGYEMGEESINHELYGSLADDLTDLYFEIKRGLDLIQVDKGNFPAALSLWRDGFFLHWGKHLLDAERHLYDLRVHHQI